MVQGVAIEDGCIVDTNPANGEVIARVPCSTPEEIASAVAAAAAAQPAWAATPLAERVALIKAALAKLATDVEALATLITIEMGKVASEAKEEAEGAVAKDDFIALVEAANAPEVVAGGDGDGAQSVILRDPHGVVAVVSPWNFPSDEMLLLAIPALVAGNTVVFKPSEVAPLTGAKVAEALMTTLPKDACVLLQGDGAVGAALVASDVHMVAFTGSTAVGRHIMASCAGSLKRLVLELGGKDPMVVFGDADLDKAAEIAVQFSLFNCGQVCCAVERVYVDEAVAPAFEDKCAALARGWTAADPNSADAKIGPMVSARQREIVAEHVDDAVANGARVLVGGAGPAKALADAPATAAGNYYPATVLADVGQDWKMTRDETFGPVVALTPFDGTEAAAVKLANDTSYGLSGVVCTRDLAKGARVAAQIKAGQVGVNNWPLAAAPLQCPWIGAKGSGFGYHSGADGWRQFSVPKSLIFSGPLPPEFVP